MVQVDKVISITILNREGYLPPKSFTELPSEEKKEFFTLNAENNLDIVVFGNVNAELSDSYTLRDLQKNYDKVCTISAVSDNTSVDSLKHWKVTAQ